MLHTQIVLMQYKAWRTSVQRLLKTATDQQCVIVTANGMPVQVLKYKAVIINRAGDANIYTPEEATVVATHVRVKGLPCVVCKLKTALQNELRIVQDIINGMQTV